MKRNLRNTSYYTSHGDSEYLLPVKGSEKFRSKELIKISFSKASIFPNMFDHKTLVFFFFFMITVNISMKRKSGV